MSVYICLVSMARDSCRSFSFLTTTPSASASNVSCCLASLADLSKFLMHSSFRLDPVAPGCPPSAAGSCSGWQLIARGVCLQCHSY